MLATLADSFEPAGSESPAGRALRAGNRGRKTRNPTGSPCGRRRRERRAARPAPVGARRVRRARCSRRASRIRLVRCCPWPASERAGPDSICAVHGATSEPDCAGSVLSGAWRASQGRTGSVLSVAREQAGPTRSVAAWRDEQAGPTRSVAAWRDERAGPTRCVASEPDRSRSALSVAGVARRTSRTEPEQPLNSLGNP